MDLKSRLPVFQISQQTLLRCNTPPLMNQGFQLRARFREIVHVHVVQARNTSDAMVLLKVI
jgi:hypothetical protein